MQKQAIKAVGSPHKFLCLFVEAQCRVGRQARESLRHWIAAPDVSPSHNTARASRYKETGTWFIQGDTFNTWKTTGSLLWIRGIRTLLSRSASLWSLIISGFVAGSGKSVLWYAVSLILPSCQTDIINKFHYHRGHQTQRGRGGLFLFRCQIPYNF